MHSVKEAYIAYRTVAKVEDSNALLLDSPDKAADYLAKYWEKLSPDVESFVVVCLNTRRRAMHVSTITTGTATASLAHPREVFRLAIMKSATSIIIAHNHPSGDPDPSGADVAITRQLREAGETVGIEVADHIILGSKQFDPSGKGFYSFRSAGLI